MRFGQILDEKLSQASAACGAPRQIPDVPAFGPPVFVVAGAAFLAGAPRAAVFSAYRSAGASCQAPQPAAPRRVSLSPAQARALDRLRSLGVATLGAGFTEAELKSAFRSVARAVHPDRHAHASEAERARLSRTFAGACEAYRELTRLFVN